MIDFIIKYWIEFAFGILTAVVSFGFKSLKKKIQEKESEQNAIKVAMIAILHDKLFSLCKQYLALGYIPVDDSEGIMDNVKGIYEAYHALGGNGTGTDIYNKFLKLRIMTKEQYEQSIGSN